MNRHRSWPRRPARPTAARTSADQLLALALILSVAAVTLTFALVVGQGIGA
jgi:hypothetical protein